MDMGANYDPQVDYRFFRELATPPPNMPPLGSKGVTANPWDDMKEVLIQPSRMISTGGNVQGLTSVPAPKCSMSRLWETAAEKGAPKNAVAIVHLNASGYTFRIKAAEIDLDFDMDCRLVKHG